MACPVNLLPTSADRVGPPDAPHIWVHGGALDEFTRARPLLTGLAERHSRYRLLLTAPDDATRRRLRQEFPGATVRPPLRPVERHVRRTLGQLRPHGLLLLERLHDLGPLVFERARWWRFPVVLVGGTESTLAGVRRELLACVDHFVVREPAVGAALRARGIGRDVITLVEASSDAAPEGVLAAVEALFVRDWMAVGTTPPRGPAGWARRFVASPLGQLLLKRRARRIESMTALRGALGAYETILCLGNGPSAEDPRVLRMPFDALFRVNCSWTARPGPHRPQFVFTGNADCLQHVASCVFAFRTVEEEMRVLMRHLVRPRPWRVSYCTVERLPISINARRWPARPTNGAAMVATAAALAPRRLVIAGMDLYAHPAGAYPGEPGIPNEYLLMHDRDTEIDVVALALAGFAGEVEILSPPLARALAARRQTGAEA